MKNRASHEQLLAKTKRRNEERAERMGHDPSRGGRHLPKKSTLKEDETPADYKRFTIQEETDE